MDVVSIIEELKGRGKTIFLSTHILNDIERVCDRIAILHGGKILVEENLDTLMSRYIQPVYDVELSEPLTDEQLGSLEKKEYLEKMSVDGRKLSFWMKNINTGGNSLITDTAALGNRIVSIDLRKSSLEEIFLKVVK
jgi:ABC-2 type transport system ATP-binding protein